MLGGDDIVDSQEASSLSHNRNNIHLYSNSWGPSDHGYIVHGPGPLVQQAFTEGTNEVSLQTIVSLHPCRSFHPSAVCE